ncbi:O-Antigen ligase [compost metagenome]
MGAHFAVMYLFSFALMINSTRWRWLKYAVMTNAFLVSTLLTMSRSAMLAMLVMTIVYLFMIKKLHYLLYLTIPAFPLIVVNYSIVEPLFSLLTNRITLSFDPTSSDNLSALDRMDAWRHGLEVFLDNPIAGVGYAGYPHFTTSVVVTPESYYIEILADLGIIGFFLFMTFSISALYKYLQLFRASRQQYEPHFSNLLAALFAALIGLLVGNLTANNFFDPSLLLLFLVISTLAFNLTLSGSTVGRISSVNSNSPSSRVTHARNSTSAPRRYET